MLRRVEQTHQQIQEDITEGEYQLRFRGVFDLVSVSYTYAKVWSSRKVAVDSQYHIKY
jgi:hypothetical protein